MEYVTSRAGLSFANIAGLMPEIHSTRSAFEWLSPRLRQDVEELWALALDARLNLLAGEMIFRGTATFCPVHAREIFRFAIRENAVTLILAHSHPSGDNMPSHADLILTRRLCAAGRLLQLPISDHLILAGGSYTSMATLGVLARPRRTRK